MLILTEIISHSLKTVVVETFHLMRGMSPSDAKTIILEVMDAFRLLFPSVQYVHVKFDGVNDFSWQKGERVRDIELYNRNLWTSSKIGQFLPDNDLFVCSFN
jgi:hypothetical protein